MDDMRLSSLCFLESVFKLLMIGSAEVSSVLPAVMGVT